MLKNIIICLLLVLGCLDLSASAFSKVDSLYFELETVLNNSQDTESIVNEIVQEQNSAIGHADVALNAILQAQLLILGGKSEALALELLGHHSLYMYDNDRKTLGDGAVNYFTVLKTSYQAQNALLLISPEQALANWFNQLRPLLRDAGLNAPTDPAGPEYNYDMLTLIDYNVELLRDLDSGKLLDKILINTLMTSNQQSQQMAVNLTGQGIQFVNNFSSVVQALNDEKNEVDDPSVIDAVLAAVPDSDTENTFTTIQGVYQSLADYVDQNGTSDKDGYIELYDQLRPYLIQASQ